MESSPSPSTPSSSSQASSSTPSGSSQTASTPSSASSSDVALMEKELLGGASCSGAAGGTGSGGPIAVYTGNQEQGEWMDVAHTQATKVCATHAYKLNCVLSNLPPDSEATFAGPYAAHGLQMELNPTEHYKFRVAGVSAAGIGPWSEILDCHPANPGAALLPTDIKVTKTQSGIVVTWEPPFINSVETLYTVRIALEEPSAQTKLLFEPIYHGRNRICVVPPQHLARAKIDKTDKPCAIFRITAKTGSQEATIQVRWLQDKQEDAAQSEEEAGKN